MAGERGVLAGLDRLRAPRATGGVSIVRKASPIRSAAEAEVLRVYRSTIIKENERESSAAYKYALAVGSLDEHLRNNSSQGSLLNVPIGRSTKIFSL
ncbi:hypothetical protein DAA51_33595 [Bradyrhizobium sp. WBAH10]|nr:hypothetical protein [Bradyrhizobium sp. WBAH30]MDD1547341.1 hypothetical protein [Bradyrhizobium sp. WBAH41]MDD1560979.1 hypothetical protein [Bradyrhizobium sp. WBAH23]MDD1568422.1 hypothetical protein [Bradyrhizobium sp. WBAH33]MDD1594348.1 hypothetical protein [Bradyrhizobium sp. WBAH42]NRB91881.1 hypothetical protein [Bradyrhizobium sp. WBAH10]QCJ92899.1 hypothetical protein DAA57_33840 [Bradyrhizobium yuanmingense]